MNPNKVFDALLVLQYQSGDKKALGLLVKRHHAKLCRHSYWYTHDLDAAKDVVQDSWSIIITKLGSIRDPNAFGSWAMRIVTRKSLDFLNRNKNDREKLASYRNTPHNLGAEEDKESDLIRLENAIRLLPKNQQVVLRLFYTEEYSLKEISTILEISIGTIKSRLFHAREKLKTILKK
ncbi:RNA polymerase sigma factor [Ulvibacterium sp.]|uniref:RNA polymerase sigma factor n=1 Tax=Ulvibacterium sp. TaxID=2665914 RepID=UPI003CC5F7DF